MFYAAHPQRSRARAGMDLMKLQALMGHATLKMTKGYFEMLDDDLIDAHREYGSIVRYISYLKRLIIFVYM